MFGKNSKRVVKTTQEQATAAWIGYLNQIRIQTMLDEWSKQNGNLERALGELQKIKNFIGNPRAILGSQLTKHGEIAEHMQVHISNARNLVEGLEAHYTFEKVGRTAPEDYLFDGRMVQSKFYNGAKGTLEAIHRHLEKYSYFVNQGGFYEIPQEQYEEMVHVLHVAETKPSALSKSEFSLLKKINEFQQETGLDLKENIRPACVKYKEVQQGTSEATLETEIKSIRKRDADLRSKIVEKGKPTLKEGMTATAVGTLLEGGVAFCMAIAEKRRAGKSFSDFTKEDWNDIFSRTGKSSIQGSVRGSTVYALTNFTVTPANLASAYVTAAFGIAMQVEAVRNKTVSREDFVINCETVVLDAAVSVIATTLGQTMIPVPVLGALLGNVIGEIAYGFCQNYVDENEKKRIDEYWRRTNEWKQESSAELEKLKTQMNREMKNFSSLKDMVFDTECNESFFASIKLAEECGVKKEKILKSDKERDRYFRE